VIGWVFALWLVIPLAGVPSVKTFAPDGRLGPYPTKDVCEAARTEIQRLDPWTEQYFLDSCVPR
jgi:hypothetical protein